jgi:uncharacterized delta-60 repeat protein
VVEVTVTQQDRITVIASDHDNILVASYLADGNLNPAFSQDGTHRLPFPFIPQDAVVDPPGEVVAGQAGGQAAGAAAVAAPGPAGPVAVQGPRIVAAGESGSTFNGLFTVTRYHPFDQFDTTFGIIVTNFLQEGGSARALCVAVDRQHRIAAAGSIRHTDDTTHFAVARYLSTGAIDNSFSGNGRTVTHFQRSSEARAATFAGGQGRLVVAGFVGDGDFDFALARYLNDGTLDAGWSGDGRVTTHFPEGTSMARTVKADGRGRIVAAGFAGSHFALARYLSNGTLDAGFSGDGRAITDTANFGHGSAHDLYIDPGDETITAVGTASGAFGVARFRDNGTPDASFSNDGRVRTDIGAPNEASVAHAVVADSQRRLVVAGVVNIAVE